MTAPPHPKPCGVLKEIDSIYALDIILVSCDSRTPGVCTSNQLPRRRVHTSRANLAPLYVLYYVCGTQVAGHDAAAMDDDDFEDV